MRFARILFVIALVPACDSHPEEYANLQECFDDHTGAEGLSVEESIVICALDHPETGGADLATADDCVDFVDLNLDTESATIEEIEAACDEYIVQKDS
jgi:hypothetical protein